MKRVMSSCRAAEIGASACCSWSEVTYCCAGEVEAELEGGKEVDPRLDPCHGCADARWAALRMGAA